METSADSLKEKAKNTPKRQSLVRKKATSSKASIEKKPVRETTQKYTSWFYPSQIEKLQKAAKDHERRHPKRPKIGIAGLLRMAVDQIPDSGEELDRYIDKAMN